MIVEPESEPATTVSGAPSASSSWKGGTAAEVNQSSDYDERRSDAGRQRLSGKKVGGDRERTSGGTTADAAVARSRPRLSAALALSA